LTPEQRRYYDALSSKDRKVARYKLVSLALAKAVQMNAEMGVRLALELELPPPKS
jgi:hypothetical protein